MASHMNVSPQDAGTRKRRRIWVVPVVLLVLAALVYLGGVVAFHLVFMPGTILDGTDVSLRVASEVAEEKASSLSDYQAHVTGDGVDLTISSDQIDLAYDGNAYAHEGIAATNPWTWPVALTQQTRSVSASSAVVFDQEALLALFEPFESAAQESADSLGGSAVVYDAEAGSFGLDPSITALYLDDAALIETLSQAFTSQQAEIALGDDQLSKPDDALHAAVDAANAYLGSAGATLTLDGETAAEVTPDVIASWVTIGDDLSVSLSTDAAAAWANESVSRLNTVGSERTFTRADGKQVTVSGGTYGWKVNETGIADALVAAVSEDSPQAIEVPFDQRGAVIPDEGGRDWGQRYIDIDLSEQYVRMYGDDGSVIWESACVTGNTSMGWGTPTGVYTINENMTRNTVLIGLDYDEDGEPDYETPVSYWMPFVGNLVALHDAQRYNFGGTIYQWNGSHGCVNLPYDKAESLYGLVQVGDVVVCHW